MRKSNTAKFISSEVVGKWQTLLVIDLQKAGEGGQTQLHLQLVK